MSDTKNYSNPLNLNKFQHFFYDYGRYHNNNTNILIHILFVPIIFTTLMFMTRHASKVYFNSDFNFGAILLIIITPLYIYVDFFLGLLTSIQYILLDHLSKGFEFSFGGFSTIQIVVIIHILSWASQFIGHGVFEGRKPALMDNLLLTLNAPIFVNIEIFYYLFGYKKEEIDESKKYIVEEIKSFRSKSKRN